MATISLIIPAFNRCRCIVRALESVRAQGDWDLEVILGDDASTDGTESVAVRAFSGLRVVRLAENSGAAAARNAAMGLATGEYVAFLDSDDEWLPKKLERQLAFLEGNPDVAVCAAGHLFKRRDGRDRVVVVPNPLEWWRELQWRQPFHGASTPVVRRAVLESVGLQDEGLRVLEDWDWMLRIAQQHRIHVLPEVLAVIHENGPSNPDYTFTSTERFLAKHAEGFARLGEKDRRVAVAQHWENAARCFFRHSRNNEGMRCLWRVVKMEPQRKGVLAAAFPIAFFDSILGTRLLRRVLATRGGYSLV